MNQYVRAARMSGLIEQLHVESDPAQREVLQSLLVQEEDRFARHSELIDLLDGWIADAETRIAKLAALVPSEPSEAAQLGQRLLQNSQEMLDLLRSRRTGVEQQLDRSTRL